MDVDMFDRVEAEFASSPIRCATLLRKGELAEGQPDNKIQLHRARDVLHDPECSRILRDAIWAIVIKRVRVEPQPWQLAAIWLMLPGLRGIASRLHHTWRIDKQDIQSDVA